MDTYQTKTSLLKRLKNVEDDASWQEFFDTYWRLIYKVATQAGLTPSEAQDVVQETVIAVARKMPGFEYVRGRDSFKGWLLQMTRFKIGEQYRKRRDVAVRRAPDESSVIRKIPDPAGPELERLWETEWTRYVLKAALKRVKRQVNPEHYEVFKLYILHKKPVTQVAESLGVSTAQVYTVKSRIAELLQKEIKRLEANLV